MRNMKKTIFLLAVMVLTVFATNYWQEQPCWAWNNQTGGWDPQQGLVDAKCRKFLDIIPGLAGSCNKDTWQIPFYDQASIAQWAAWSLTGNRVLDLVRKPGTFIGAGPTFCLNSNGDITVTFSGFDNLHKIGSPNDSVEKYYAYSGLNSQNVNLSTLVWFPATSLPNAYFVMHDYPATVYLYEKIVVGENDPACEYEDPLGGTMTITLTNQKPWIDGPTGNYKPDQPVGYNP